MRLAKGVRCQDGDTRELNPRMKLHHLLQKCSFFLIKLAAFQASGAACMKLHLFKLNIYAVKFSSSIRPAVFWAGGWADVHY